MVRLRIILVILLTLWVGFVLAAFYVVQKPLAMQVGAGLLFVLWTLVLTGLLLVESAGMGVAILRRSLPLLGQEERILLGTGLGLGIFGLAGFGLAAAGVACPGFLLLILAGALILLIWKGWMKAAKEDFSAFWQAIRHPLDKGLKWMPWVAGIALTLSFLLAFATPMDSFDALSYHLAVPAAWLRDGGLTAPLMLPHYWFPDLVEGAFVWALALKSETTAPLLHLAWGVLTVGMIWTWARKVWNNAIAWRAVMVLISMPSLLLLAAWAYTDLALAFYSLGALYFVWLDREASDDRAWIWSGVFCGFAMGIKYTSFVLPLVALAWLAWSRRRSLSRLVRPAALFIAAAVVVASPWYLRNWIWMGNPFFPFLFGGKYWDTFLSLRTARPGTGIGFNLRELFLLPLTLTLGTKDANYLDGRIGPLWLVLLPAGLWVLWNYRRDTKRLALYIPALFGVASLMAWIVGIASTIELWQARLLFPAILPLAALAALAWESLKRLDFQRFRFSFIFNILVILSILVGLLDFGLFVLARDPLSVGLGITSRQTQYERFQPSYADALALVDRTPPGAKVYLLFEPRSYGMSRFVQPDLILSNLDHDFYLYHTPENILQAWRSEGYSYILFQKVGEASLSNPDEAHQLFSGLDMVAETENTILYRLPSL